MPNNINDFDKELLLKEYELNMSDHDRKEKMAWLASTLYYTFCIAVIGFILSNENIKNELNSLSCLSKWFIICLIIILFICVNLFVGYQFNRKNKSFQNIENIQKIFLELIKRDTEIYKLLYILYAIEKKDKKNNNLISCADLSILILIFLFFLIKLILILNFFYPNYYNIFYIIYHSCPKVFLKKEFTTPRKININ